MNEKQKESGALWKKQSKAGAPYLSLTIDGKSYVGFANKYKEKDNQPDYKLYESIPLQRQEETLYEQPKMTRQESAAHFEEVGGRDEIKPEDLAF